MDRVKIPLFRKGDLDASVGVFFDGFSKIIVFISVLIGTFHLDSSTVFGTMMPGLFVSVLMLNGGLWLYYRHLAQQRGDATLTAIPASVQAGRMFIWLYSIMLPVYEMTGDATLAYRVGVLAHFLGGFVFIVGAFAMPAILRIVPAGALFGALSGAAMAFLVLQSINGTLAMPLVGWISLVVLFVIYLGKIETRLPAALIAIVVGAGMAWGTGAMGVDAITSSVSHVGFYLPGPVPQIFAPEVVSLVVEFIPIIIVFSLNECITGIQGVEQARTLGETHFTATKPLCIAGISGMVGALFGNPLATGLYWGYPGWKQMGAGTGYHLGILMLYALVGLTGLTAIITAFIPEAAVLPILVFLGITSYAQAFEVVDRKYYPAAIMASLPLVMSFMMDNVADGALSGFWAFDSGSAFIGLLVGCLFVFVIDNDWLKASITNVVALGLTLIGMIHSPMPILTAGYAPDRGFIIAYALLAVGFFVLHCVGFNKKARETKARETA